MKFPQLQFMRTLTLNDMWPIQVAGKFNRSNADRKGFFSKSLYGFFF